MTVIQRFYKVKLFLFFMNMKILGLLALIAITLICSVEASSSSVDIVSFTVNPYNESYENNSFEGFVGGLSVESKGKYSISWVWENSEEEGFFYNLVFLDSILVMNGTDEFFGAEGLDEGECYEFSIVGIGDDGSEGPRVSDTFCTTKKKRSRDKGDSEIVSDVVPYFFSEDKDIPKDTTIVLGSSVVESRGYNWMILLCWVLSLLIFVLLALIFVFSRN